MSIIQSFLQTNKNRQVKIAVVGDSMIDEYFNVKVTRVSPEFPVQVMHSRHWRPSQVAPGGAANVCQQMHYFNADCFLISPLDKFSTQEFKKCRFNTDFCVTMPKGHIPIKRRFYDDDFPLPRWDIEDDDYNEKDIDYVRNEIFNNMLKIIRKHDINVVILSDYGKGVFTGDGGPARAIIDLCNSHKIPTIIDPKDMNVSKWRNCSVFKPNAGWAKEFCKKVGYSKGGYKNNWEAEADTIKQHTDCKHVVITESGSGVYADGKYHVPIKVPHVKSVIGAGDCFCGFLAMGLASGMSVTDAAWNGFNAGLVYVEAKHNQPITPYQLSRWDDPIRAKLVTADELASIKATFPKRRWVWTNGCFDLLHAGHLKTFEEARKHGDKVIVGLNTDDSVKRLKGENRPVFSYEQRAMHLAHLMYVDFIVPIEDDTPLSLIKMLKPDKIIKGGDYIIKDIAGCDVVGRENVILVDLLPDVSTTKIVTKIKDL